MRHFLKSTYGQLTFMFGLLLLVNFIVIILSLRELSFKPAASQFAIFIDNQIKGLKPLLIDKDFNSAQKLLTQTFPTQEIILKKQVDGSKLPNFAFYQTLLKQLQSNQNHDLKVLLHESDRESRIWIQPHWLNGYWLGISFKSFISQVPRWLIFIFISLLLLSLLAAFFFSRYMLKPFKNLAQMASDVVSEKTSLDEINIKGTREVREISGLVKASVQQIQQLNKEKEMLLAGVSHDLRTPLARMRLQAEFLNDDESRDAIVQDIEEMDAIIGDFVAYVRSGSFEETQRLDVVEIIQQAIKQYTSLGKMIEFKAPVQEVLLEVKPLCLKRMLTNVFDNAYKYGKPPVQVTIDNTDTNATIKIIDHGEGLHEAELKSIFDPFVMAQSTDNQYGSGLGLSIVKKMADQINARVSVKNQELGGLCVCIEFNQS